MKILLVSDEQEIVNEISEKLIFLRNDDDVVISSYDNALLNSNLSSLEVVLVCEDGKNSKTVNLIKELNKKSNLSIILINCFGNCFNCIDLCGYFPEFVPESACE